MPRRRTSAAAAAAAIRAAGGSGLASTVQAVPSEGQQRKGSKSSKSKKPAYHASEFQATVVGTEEVSKPTKRWTMEHLAQCIERHSRIASHDRSPSWLRITVDVIAVVGPKRRIVAVHPLETVEFCGAVGGNTDRLALVSRDTSTGTYQCLVLKANRGRASQLLRVISDALSTSRISDSDPRKSPSARSDRNSASPSPIRPGSSGSSRSWRLQQQPQQPQQPHLSPFVEQMGLMGSKLPTRSPYSSPLELSKSARNVAKGKDHAHRGGKRFNSGILEGLQGFTPSPSKLPRLRKEGIGMLQQSAASTSSLAAATQVLSPATLSAARAAATGLAAVASSSAAYSPGTPDSSNTRLRLFNRILSTPKNSGGGGGSGSGGDGSSAGPAASPSVEMRAQLHRIFESEHVYSRDDLDVSGTKFEVLQKAIFFGVGVLKRRRSGVLKLVADGSEILNADRLDTLDKLKKLSHENTGRFTGFCLDAAGTVVFGLATWSLPKQSASLQAVLSSDSVQNKHSLFPRSTMDALQLCRGVAAGLGFLHESDVVHGFLSTSTVHVSASGTVKVVGYGLSSVVREYGQEVAYSTRRFQPSGTKKASQAGDVYAAGVICSDLTYAARVHGTHGIHTMIAQCKAPTAAARPRASRLFFLIVSMLADDSSDEENDDGAGGDGDDQKPPPTMASLAGMSLRSTVPSAVEERETAEKDATTEAARRKVAGMSLRCRVLSSDEQAAGKAAAAAAAAADAKAAVEAAAAAEAEAAAKAGAEAAAAAAAAAAEAAEAEAAEAEAAEAAAAAAAPEEVGPAGGGGGAEEPAPMDDFDFFALLAGHADTAVAQDLEWDMSKEEGEWEGTDDHLDGPARWAAKFVHMITDPAGIVAFRKFLKTISCDENVMFHEAVEEFRKLPAAAAASLPDKGTALYKRFVMPGARKSINIKSETQKSIKADVDAKKFAKNMFAAAQKEIYFLMKTDSYPRFVASSAYTSIVAAAMSPPPKSGNARMLVNSMGDVGSPALGGGAAAAASPGGATTTTVPATAQATAATTAAVQASTASPRSPTKEKKRGFKLFGRKKGKGKGRATPEAASAGSPKASPAQQQQQGHSMVVNDVVEVTTPVLFRVTIALAAGDASNVIRTVVQAMPQQSVEEAMAKLMDRQKLAVSEFELIRCSTNEELAWTDVVAEISSQEIKLQRKAGSSTPAGTASAPAKSNPAAIASIEAAKKQLGESFV